VKQGLSHGKKGFVVLTKSLLNRDNKNILLQQKKIVLSTKRLVAAAKFLVAATKILSVVPNFVAVKKRFFPCPGNVGIQFIRLLFQDLN